MAAALFAALLLVFASGVQAQTITNTARANWRDAGSAQTTVSNTVSFSVGTTPAATLEPLTVVPGSGQSIGLSPSGCNGGALLANGIGGANGLASVKSTATITPGEVLLFRVNAPAENLDGSAIDKITAVLTTSAGDQDEITVYETSANSGVFVGAIPTAAIPPEPVRGDCRLSLHNGDRISILCKSTGREQTIAQGSLDVLADPYGLVFDSEDGRPVDGVTVTMVDAASGAPATIYAPDGLTRWPSSVVTGGTVTDATGNTYRLPKGEYWFPLAALGSYRLVVSPPSPYSAPSKATAAQLASMTRPDGAPLILVAGSYGQAFTLSSPAAVRIDVPLDRPSPSVTLTKTASRNAAAPGDVVLYSVKVTNPDTVGAKRNVVVTDTPSVWLRLRASSLRIDGQPAPGTATFAPDGRTMTLAIGDVAPGATRTMTYAMTVRADAPPGQAVNKVVAVDSRGRGASTQAVIKLERDTIAGRMTIIGRVVDGGCSAEGPHRGVPNVRVMLEDGSFAITDIDGRYHFDGVVPGSHVVAVAPETLVEGGRFVDCTRSTRSAGNAASRFVTGRGGSLAVADFAATLPAAQAAPAPAEAFVASDREAAGGDTDWLALGDGPTGFLFPEADYNPRVPAIRVAIRHRKG
ncbi:MAG: isopeptide-forming domain-containing fimbrial protein, partial [Novosphingobium sp.]